MATEFTLRRADGIPFGTFEQVEALIRRQFPKVEFRWTTSGPEKLKLARKRKIEFPPELKQILATMPSLREGVAEGRGYHVTFGLGATEPVTCLFVTPRGTATKLNRGLEALESEAGAQFKVSGED